MHLGCYKLPCQHCYSSGPQILTCIFIFIQFNSLKKMFLDTSSLTQWIIEKNVANFQFFGSFPVIFLLLASSLISLWSENTFFIVSILLNFSDCWMAHGMVHLAIRSISTWKECVFMYYWVECTKNIYLIWLVDGIVEFFLIFCQVFLSIVEKGILEVSNYTGGFVYFSFHFYQFLFHIFYISVWSICT